MKAYEQALHMLEALKLKGVVNCLDEELDEAESQKLSYIGFLSAILNREISDRKYPSILLHLFGVIEIAHTVGPGGYSGAKKRR